VSTLKPRERIDELLPYGMIATRKWLSSQGMNRHAIDNALKSKKLESLAVGVYTRSGFPVSWQGIVYSLQRMCDQPIYLGGLSALEQLGFGQYLSVAKVQNIHLYSETRFPSWLGKILHDVNFKWHGTKKLWPDVSLVKYSEEEENYLREVNWHQNLPPLKISCPEKAYLEILMDVPKSISFDHANELIQGMTSLSPKKLEALLKSCRSVKVKRLFFWFAEKQKYTWFKKLDIEKFDLGKGKRVIAESGKLDKKYLITVPEHLYGSN